MSASLVSVFNNISEESLIYDVLPHESFFEEGSKSFFLNRDEVRHLKDLTVDSYSPWTGKTLDGRRVTAKHVDYPIEIVSGVFRIMSGGNFKLKVISNTNPREKFFKRKISYILNETDDLVTHVNYSYTAEVSLSTPASNNKRILPSDSVLLKNIMDHRSSTDTRKILFNEGSLDLAKKIPSLSRFVPTHVKSNLGRVATTDFHDIYERFFKKLNCEELLMRPEAYQKEDEKCVQRVCVLYVDAIKCFGAGLPYLPEFKNHLESVAMLDSQNERERTEYFNTFLSLCDHSGSLGHLGCSLMVDTTFDIAREYVTILCGVSQQFLNGVSGKNSSIILGIMLHTEKTLENHEIFSSFFNDALEKYAPGKIIPGIITDGEESLYVYNSGSFLKDSIRCRCDVHRWSNIKTLAEKEHLDTNRLQDILFGRKIETPIGSCLRKGLFGSLTKIEFDEMFPSVLNFLNLAPKTKDWFLANKQDLYATHSLRKKLECGWITQYHSTNILESRNASIKQVIKHRKSGNDILDDFLFIHKSEIHERKNAIKGLTSSLSVQVHITNAEYESKSVLEKRYHLASYGLSQSPFNASIPENLRSILRKLSRVLTESAMKFDLHKSAENENFYFVVRKNPKETTLVELQKNKFSCHNAFCQKARTKDKLCVHKVSVLLNSLLDDQRKIGDVLTTIYQKKGIVQIVREQTNAQMGSKFTKRRGKAFSSNNRTRRYLRLLNSSAEAYDLNFQAVSMEEETESEIHSFDKNNNACEDFG